VLDVISRGQRIALSLTKAHEEKILNKHLLRKQAGAYFINGRKSARGVHKINGGTRVLRRLVWGGGAFSGKKTCSSFH